MQDDESEPDRERRTSDFPADLTREREVFVRQFLRKGVELTESLLEENRDLHEQLAKARDENARFRAQIASDDAIRDLLRKIEQLEEDRRQLLARSDQLEQSSRQNASRSNEMEQELNDLANLYIASSHLHSTLSVRGVIRHLGELLQQLMGAEQFVIFLMDHVGQVARPLLIQELDGVTDVASGDGPIGLAMTTGMPRIKEDPPLSPGSLEDPLAIIPMTVRDVSVGAIVVVSVLGQKERWAAVDRALFDFLGSHAATALIAANQYTTGGQDPRTALEGIERHLSPPPQ
jgi:hypothetical protein